MIGVLDGGRGEAGAGEGDGGHDDHGGVDEPGAVHGDEDVDEFEAEIAETDAAARGFGGPGELLQARLDKGGVEIDDVRHDGGAKHADGGVEGVLEGVRVEAGYEGGKGGGLPIGVDEKDLEAVAKADDTDEEHDAAFEPLEAGEIECEDTENGDGGDEGGGEERLGGGEAVGLHPGAGEEIEAEGSAEEFG